MPQRARECAFPAGRLEVSEHVTARAIRMVGVSGIMLLWQQAARVTPCMFAAAVLVILAMAIGAAGLESAVQRRHTFTTQYLASEGRLFRLLRPGAFMILWQGTKALVLATILVLNALVLEVWEWVLLFGDALLMAVLFIRITRSLSGEVRALYVAPLARRAAVWVNATFVWVVWVLGLFNTPQSNFSAMRWEEVVMLAAGQVDLGCQAIALLARVAAVGESLALWAAQNLFADISDVQAMLAAWLVFLAAFGASFLFAWAYSLALAGVISAPWQVWRWREVPSE